MAQKSKYAPNRILRRLREERGWSLQRVADELRLLAEAEDENRLPGVNANMVGVWERGWKRPSPFYQALFCQLYRRSASQLSFMDDEATSTAPPFPAIKPRMESLPTPPLPPVPQLTRNHEQTQAIDSLCSAHDTDVGTDHQAGAWLMLGASGLSQLFNEGWTLTDILTSLQMVLQSMQSLPPMTRRRLLHLGGAAILSSIPMPTGERMSEEERVAFTRAMGESIEESWRMFTEASMPQVLAIGQAQLQLLHHASTAIYQTVRPLLYSPVYRLVGATLFFQSRYKEALHTHHCACVVALEAGDVWNMAESLSWEAGILKACGEHARSIQTTEAAFRLLDSSNETRDVVSKARLLAQWAESAALLGERSVMEEKLAASENLLAQNEGNDEFNAAIWQLYQGTCSLYIGDTIKAEQSLDDALRELKPHLLHERAMTLLLQAQARLKMGNAEGALKSVRDALPLVLATTSSLLDRGLIDLVERLMIPLSGNEDMAELAAVVQRHPRLHTISTQHCVPRYLEATL